MKEVLLILCLESKVGITLKHKGRKVFKYETSGVPLKVHIEFAESTQI